MTLAARCPSCGTVFRVVQDQLRVSEGWVRCGRCGEVFNAVQNLVDLEVDVAVPRRPATDEPSPGIGADAPSHERTEPAAEPPAAADSGFHVEDAAPAAPASFGREDVAHEASTTQPPFGDDPLVRPEPPPQPTTAGTGAAASPPAAPDAHAGPDTIAEPAPTPDFVRHADAKARWRQPGVRAALVVGCVAATLALAAQAAHEWRDSVAARWPAARPLLEAMCQAPCRIGAPRDIEGLSVESSGLVRVDGTSMYQLQVLLRNRSALPLAVPALDLTLSDTRGATVARRVLTAEDTDVAVDALQPAAELPIQVTLATGGRAIAGYTIEIFYP